MLLLLRQRYAALQLLHHATNAHRHTGRTKEGPYDSTLADSEREAVAELLQYLENVRRHYHMRYSTRPGY